MQKTAHTVFRKSAMGFRSELEVVADFLIKNPELAPKPSQGDTFGSEFYWEKIALKFNRGRMPRAPQEPSTIPDPMVSVILESYFGVDPTRLSTISKEHSLSMAAENIVGDILERYIAQNLEPYGWVWCSGEVIKKVDFLAARKSSTSEWIPLQIKNRDNSENSSSSSVREGTEIVKWFRTFSRTGHTNWEAFPETIDGVSLNENDFQSFAKDYLRIIRS